MRNALCVGINYYKDEENCLSAAVNDARAIGRTLASNFDGSENFKVTTMLATNEENAITAKALKKAVKELFSGSPDVALFYYAGHGALDAFGGYLCTSEIDDVDEGLSLDFLMSVVKSSKAQNKIIILDSCHSGFAGNSFHMPSFALIPDNTTILAACRKDQYASEQGGRGIFTSLLFDALNGGAMNILGEISAANIYSYIDRSLSPWDQRPVFKANIQNFVCLRRHNPPIDIQDLRKITEFFYDPNTKFPLNPKYEDDKRDVTDKTHYEKEEADFKILRKYYKLNLLVPVDLPEDKNYMYWAAVYSKSCELTPLGRHYWHLVRDGQI